MCGMSGSLVVAAAAAFIFNLTSAGDLFVGSLLSNSHPAIAPSAPLGSLAVVGAIGSEGKVTNGTPKVQECERGHFYTVEVDPKTAQVTVHDLGIDPNDDPINPRFQGKVFYKMPGVSGTRGILQVACDSSVDASKWKVLSQAAKVEDAYAADIDAQVQAMTPEKELTLTEILALNKHPLPPTITPSSDDLFGQPKPTEPTERSASPNAISEIDDLWFNKSPGLSLLEEFDREKAGRPPSACEGQDVAICLQNKKLESQQWRAGFLESVQKVSEDFSRKPEETFAEAVPLPRPRPSGMSAFLEDPIGTVKDYVAGAYNKYFRGASPEPSEGAVTAAQEPTFNDRARDAFSQDWTAPDAATAKLLQKRGTERLAESGGDTIFGTRESPLTVPPTLLPAPDPEQRSVSPPADERPVPYEGPLPSGMSLSADGRLKITRDPDVQSSREFDEYKNERLLNEARKYAATDYPIVVDSGDEVVVLPGEKYGLKEGVARVRGNNLGNFNFGWDTNVAEKAEGTLRNGFEGYGDDGVAARKLMRSVDPETNRTLAQDIATEINQIESKKDFLGRLWESSSIYPSTVTVDGRTRTGNAETVFSAQDLVGPYDKDQPPPQPKEIAVELVPVPSTPTRVPPSQGTDESDVRRDVEPAPDLPQPSVPQPVSASAPEESAKEEPPTPMTKVEPLPEPIIVRELNVAPPEMPIRESGEEPADATKVANTENDFCGACAEPTNPTAGKPIEQVLSPEAIEASKPLSPEQEKIAGKLADLGTAPTQKEREALAPAIRGTPSVDLEINFELGSPTIKDDAKPKLDELLKVLSDPEFRGTRIFIAGHTDARGSATYDNLGLSQRRAEAIREYLTSRNPGLSSQLVAVGLGATQPKYTNPYDARNRRVQIAVTK